MCLALDVEDDEADADEEDADEEQPHPDSAVAGGGSEGKSQMGYEQKYHAFLNKAHLRLSWLNNPP